MSKYIEQRVQRGIELLDKERPGWRSEIDLHKLDMGEYNICILGQLYGDYGKGADKLFGIRSFDGSPAHYGFDKHPGLSDPFKALNDEWKKQLSTEN